MHGDFCFSNIFYDPKLDSIKVIDPRGSIDDLNKRITGAIEYDVLKLAHSFIGNYDKIIAGHFNIVKINGMEIIEFDEPSKELESYFFKKAKCEYNIDKNFIILGQISLFLSMIPLHNDRPDRQNAFYLNAVRLSELL